MKYINSLGIKGNLDRLFKSSTHNNNEIINTNGEVAKTNSKVDDNQVETDELMLDHEERLILLEVGE